MSEGAQSVKIRQRSRDKTREALQLAAARLKNSGKRFNISAVAGEAGVTPGLIHNTYPDIAEAIRAQAGKSTRQQRDKKIAEIARISQRNKELRKELDTALSDLQRLASINETLRQELAKQISTRSGNVVIMPIRDADRI